MKDFLDSFIWVFLLLFIIPSVLIVISWNALAGDGLFPVKLGLEKALAFIVSPSYEASGQLQIKYTERRFADAKRSLSERHSVEGLVYLDEQITSTKNSIMQSDASPAKSELTESYIRTLEDVSLALASQQQSVAEVPRATSPTTSAQKAEPSPVAMQVVTRIPTLVPTPTPVQVIIQIPSRSPSRTPAVTKPQPGYPVPSPTSKPAPVPSSTPTPTRKPTPTPNPTPTPILTYPPIPAAVRPPGDDNKAEVDKKIAQTQEKIKETIAELKERKKEQKKEEEARNDNKSEDKKREKKNRP